MSKTALAETAKTTTPAVRVEANRRNAARSTGPTSDGGKTIASANAARHGVLSTRPVLPGLERAEDWDRHRAGVLRSLAPVGEMEALLAERVALGAWRLGRVARYETETASIGLERAEADWARGQDERWRVGRQTPLGRAEEKARDLQARVDLLASLPDLPQDTPLEPKVAGGIVDAAAEAAEVNIYDDNGSVDGPDVELPDYPDGVDLNQVPWRAGQFTGAIEAIAGAAGQDAAELLAALATVWAEQLAAAQAERAALERSLDLFRRGRLLPEGPVLEKVARYEAALERGMYKALHELQRMQAGRQGQAVPPPAVVDVDVSGMGG